MDWNRIIELNNENRADLHIHTCFCDGQDPPETMVRSAIEKGMLAIGFSGHSTTDFDREACMSEAETRGYRKEIARLKEKYEGTIEIYCGLERDFYDAGFDKGAGFDGDPETGGGSGWDYFIGSVHYLETKSGHPSVDDTPEMLEEAIENDYGGDPYALIEDYYENVSQVAEKLGADVVGHFDLVSKYNAGGENGKPGRFFDEGDPRYRAAWRKAADRLLQEDVLFEINTGAVSRGYRSEPYPSREIRDYLRERGGRFLLSSDSHAAETIGYGFGTLQI